ncbi:GFA family protein [Afifella sp. JA880]|uniref:GFA family protein n=1 Tax=Afifella sp. JA880 TaxID=2975280 RepID=UPI0021BB5CDE|nr:GFA family protein [Afifella sp. JA880]MCT8268372.1 GFA family protein [Afifella sp. JA880]
MPMTLKGSCRCGAVHFSVESHTPQPYQLCYCSICRKTAGGGGYAINLGGIAATLKVEGREAIEIFRAEIDRGGHCEVSTGERNFCRHCATALWLFDPTWPELIHPFASAIDSELPIPPERVHLMLGSKANWVVPDIGPNDQTFNVYPDESLEGWHKSRGLWVE